jgi:hypothetical protein
MNTRMYMSQLVTALLVATGVMLAPVSSLAGEVVADDLIITGSLCVGRDCVEGMDFSFSTIQLQGKNLRLRFENPDLGWGSKGWEIIANDFYLGGNNYLGFAQVKPWRTVIFRIEAGAPADSLLVSSEGKLGVGTATPEEQLHVAGDARIWIAFVDAFEQLSSRALKHDVQDLAPATALAAVAGLHPVRYRLKSQPDEPTLGFIAEQVPDLVASPDRKTIEPMKIVAALTAAAQAQGEAIEVRQRETAELDARLERLEQALAARAGRTTR